MNAEVRQMKTAAELALAQAYAAAKPALPGGAELGALREEGFRAFDAKGLPHRRVEEWKYTDLRALMRDAKPLASPPDAKARTRAKDAGRLKGIDARRIVFVDGVLVKEFSDLRGLERGLGIVSLADALTAGDIEVTRRLGRIGPDTSDVAFALNTAFMGDGAVIYVAPNAHIERPIQLVFAQSGDKPASIFTRSLVVVDKGARLTLLESHEGPAGSESQSNNALELSLGDRAQLDYVKVTSGDHALHVSTIKLSVGAQARLNTFAFTSGGAVVRNQMFVRLAGEKTHAGIRGANLLRDRQHVDNTLVVDHAAGGCESREQFKSVLDGSSRGVFQGKIIVRPHAQKTDGKMMTQALLLSEEAEADNKPELEIFADDVQCGHGATAGALDEELLFYLKARGIPEKDAEALLIQAFIGEAVEAITHEGLRAVLMQQAVAWLQART